MFDLNMGLAGAPLLGVDGSGVCTTPRTPEILNSLIDITNPLEYSYSSARPSQVSNVDSCCSDSTLDSPAGQTTPPSVQKLTPEDEDRRRRRRERNKIAATKCRMKKRERTLNLVSESEVLEQQNIELKTQERALETQRRKLLEALQSHSSSCIRPGGYSPPSSCYQQSQCKFGSNCRMIKNDGQSQGLEIDTTHTYACKSATSDSNTTCYSSPESGCNALKSPVDLDLVTYNSPGMKNEYIPNCESGEEAVLGCSQFMLKTELTDSSPYTSVQSADRFLFENTENFDADRVPDIIRGDNNNDYTGSCGTFVENTLLKADFLSATSEFINLADGTETQFTDLDSGITTYTTLPPNSTGGGC
ncbi:activating transcription factor 3 isoform X4 [Phlebotomus papatasi]|uniref:activating transcription factor 3 isoform X4 n=1 Tax=Phlebotomus papatasi TaxID=29031 RepID=UPI00248412E9|nr:activating transcription factor 3 isoform X4 [Phlebotomus papatasi]